MAVVTQTIQDQVSQLYIAYFGRAPESDGFAFWAQSLANGTPVTTAALQMANSFEFRDAYNGLTPTQQVTKLYQNVLNRAPDASGLAYWVNLLNTGTSIGSVAWGIVNSAFQQGTATADGNLVLNKVSVSEFFAVTLGSNDKAVAQTAFNLVTSNPASVAVADAALAQAVAPTYTLTTSIETVPANGVLPLYAKVTGVVNGANGTFQTGDVVNGSGATNNVNVTIAAASGEAAGPLVALNNVNTVSFNTLAAAPVNAALYANVSNVGSVGGGSLLTVNNGDLASTYFVNNEQTGGGANNASVGGVAAGVRASQTSGTNTAINFSVANSGVRTGSVTTGLTTNNAALTSLSTGVEVINVATTGTNYIAITGATNVATDSATVNVTGSGTNTINATALTNTTTYNLGGSSGTNVLNVGANLASLTTITGGTGADTLLTSVTGVVGALTVTGVETLRLSNTAAATTLSFAANPSFTTVRLDAGGNNGVAKTLVNGSFANLAYVGAGTSATAAAAQTFNALTTTASFAGTTDTVAITVGNQGTTLNAGVGYTVGAINLSGVETLSIAVSDVTATGVAAFGGITASTMSGLTVTSAGSVTLGAVFATGALAAGTLTSINLSGVTGTGVSTLSLTNNTVTAATTITASTGGTNVTAVGAEAATDAIIFTGGAGNDSFTGTGFLGILTLSGGAGTDTFVGGSNSDVLIGGEGTDDLAGGLAADSINLTETVSAADIVRYTATNQGGAAQAGNAAVVLAAGDTVTGFATGVDTINVNAVATTHVAAAGNAGAWNFGNAGVYVLNGVLAAGSTAAQVSTAVGNVTSAGAAAGFVLIQTAAGSGTYNLYEVNLGAAHAGAAIGAGDTISLVGTWTQGAGNTIAATDFTA